MSSFEVSSGHEWKERLTSIWVWIDESKLHVISNAGLTLVVREWMTNTLFMPYVTRLYSTSLVPLVSGTVFFRAPPTLTPGLVGN